MEYSELYLQINQDDLTRVAACCSLSVEDVRQEARLICLEMAAGESDYDTAQGTVPQYVLGKLWGMTLRWQNPVLGIWEKEEDVGADEGLLLQQLMETVPWYDSQANDPLQQLTDFEEEEAGQAQRKAILDALEPGKRTFVGLIMQGLPLESVAEIYGMTPRAVRYRMSSLAAIDSAH